jgi:hypothetical protein
MDMNQHMQTEKNTAFTVSLSARYKTPESLDIKGFWGFFLLGYWLFIGN